MEGTIPISLVHTGKCPKTYTRSKVPPYNCEACPPNSKKRTVKKRMMCYPGIQCPPNMLIYNNKCFSIFQPYNHLINWRIPSHIARAMVAPDGFNHIDDIYVGHYDKRIKASVVVESQISNESERLISTYYKVYVNQYINAHKKNKINLIKYQTFIDTMYTELKQFPFHNVSFHSLFFYVSKILNMISEAITMYNNLSDLYLLLFNSFLPRSINYNALSIDYALKSKIHIARLSQLRHNPDLLDLFKEYGIFYDMNEELSLSPVAFMTFKEHINQFIPRIPLPETMFSPEEGMDIPMDITNTDNVIIVVQDANVTAYSISLDYLLKCINPRTPFALFMKCKRPFKGYTIDENIVYSDKLYVELSKTGIPFKLYVDIDQINSALNEGSTVLYIKPSMKNGLKVTTQIASAYRYKVEGISAVSASHCEEGQVGTFYDVYLHRRDKRERD